jgi:hypothetical protein
LANKQTFLHNSHIPPLVYHKSLPTQAWNQAP